MLPLGLCAQLACIWETTARNPGNAHRFRDFSDISYLDFLASAAAVATILETADQRPVGQTVLEAVRATRQVTAANTNLGVLLLLAPLCTVRSTMELRTGLEAVLNRLDVEDARAVYAAIRLAAPAGLAKVRDQDLAEEPTRSLREVMALAQERDLVARQYANGFREVFEDGLPELLRRLDAKTLIEEALIHCHLHLMAAYPDSLIARKRGQLEAEEAARRAREVKRLGWPETPASWNAFHDLDAWLRDAGRGRNPGTTSDLVTACLFVALRQAKITLPLEIPWSAGWQHERIV